MKYWAKLWDATNSSSLIAIPGYDWTPMTCTNTSTVYHLEYEITNMSTVTSDLIIEPTWAGLWAGAGPAPAAPLVAVPSARERARALLKRALSPSEWAEFERTCTITVNSQQGRRYKLHGDMGRSRNVRRYSDSDQLVEILCAHPVDSLIPIEDVLLAQKLHLECNEEEFRRIANITDPALDRTRRIAA